MITLQSITACCLGTMMINLSLADPRATTKEDRMMPVCRKEQPTYSNYFMRASLA